MIVNKACFGIAMLLVGSALAQEMDLRVQLTAPIGTDVSRKGDAISAVVIGPPPCRETSSMAESTSPAPAASSEAKPSSASHSIPFATARKLCPSLPR